MVKKETKKKTSLGLEENVEGLLCYLGVWITGIVFLVLEKNSKFVKFHALQSIITFGALTILSWVLGGIFFFGTLIWGLTIVAWIILMIKAYQGEMFKIPIAGDIAEKNG